MPSNHSFFVAAACALPLSLAACGGSDSNDTPPVPEGQHYGYVVSGVSLPITNKQKTDFALDLGAAKSSKQDGVPDNKLGSLFQFVSAAVDVQGAITTAVNAGSIILLVDFQTKDLANSSAAGFGVKIGSMPNPPACTNTADPTTCGRHLDGHGSFQIDTSASTDGVVAGKITSNAFTGGPGDVTVQLALSGTAPITLNLLRARVQATISPTGIMNANIGGLVLPAELKAQLGPILEAQVAPILTQNCPGTAPNCACTGTAASFLIPADANHDCKLTADEIFTYQIVADQIRPDICTTSSCATPDGLSIGVQVQAVKAAFTGVM